MRSQNRAFNRGFHWRFQSYLPIVSFSIAIAIVLVPFISDVGRAMSCTYTNRVYLPADVRVQAQAGYDSMAANVVRTLDQVRQVFPGMNSPSNRPILDAIEWLIQDEELVSYHTRINEVLLQIQSMPQAGQPESSSPNQRFGLL